MPERKRNINKKLQELVDFTSGECRNYYFLFFEVDKIGGGFATIETEDATYKNFYPTKRLLVKYKENKRR